jgi:hypothetical protein
MYGPRRGAMAIDASGRAIEPPFGRGSERENCSVPYVWKVIDSPPLAPLHSHLNMFRPALLNVPMFDSIPEITYRPGA